MGIHYWELVIGKHPILCGDQLISSISISLETKKHTPSGILECDELAKINCNKVFLS